VGAGQKPEEPPQAWTAPSGWQDATLYGSQDGRRYRPSWPRREIVAARDDLTRY